MTTKIAEANMGNEHAKVTEDILKLADAARNYAKLGSNQGVRFDVQAYAQLLADALRDRVVKEAEWWHQDVGHSKNPVAGCMGCERIAQLRRGEL